MKQEPSYEQKLSKGFTLVEMLVAVVILLLVLVAVYSFFDQGQWLYLGMEKQTENQQNVRIVLENMERDLRMAGGGVPTQHRTDGTVQWWTPFIFTADRSQIYFRGDIDSRNSLVTADVAAAATTIDVEDGAVVCPDPPNALILVKELKQWEPITCTAVSGNTVTVSAVNQAYSSAEAAVLSPDTVFYRLDNDANGDGICDDTDGDGQTCATDNDDFPFCNIERAVVFGNDPDADAVEDDDNFEVMAKNICKFEIHYYGLDGETPLNSDAVPLTGGFLTGISRVKIEINAKARSSKGPQQYTDVNLSTDILLRSTKY